MKIRAILHYELELELDADSMGDFSEQTDAAYVQWVNDNQIGKDCDPASLLSWLGTTVEVEKSDGSDWEEVESIS